MSVHQESLDPMTNDIDTASEAEETQGGADDESYTELRADTLAMFGAAIGGAILGMLLTLLVLALINGGTLVYGNSQEELAAVDANLQRINENVGAVSTNVDIVAAQVGDNQAAVEALAAATQDELAVQTEAIAANQEAIGQFDDTAVQFDIFTSAMSDALVSMEEAVSGDAAAADTAEASTDAEDAAPADAGSEAALPAETLPVPMVANSADVPAGSVMVVLFFDADGDGALSEGETNLVGSSVALADAAGEVLAEATGDESGAAFEALDAGDYQVMVEDALGYELLSQPSAAVTISGDDVEGYVVYIPAVGAAE